MPTTASEDSNLSAESTTLNRPTPYLVAEDPPYFAFHLWMLVAIASLFAFFMAIRTGGLAFVIENDTTFLSDLVMLFFIGSTVYCGTRAWMLSRELMAVQALQRGESDVPEGSVAQFSQALQEHGPRHADIIMEALEDRIRGAHDVGWFITETLTKLGLLGTVIGFLIMLTALIGAEQLELSAMQVILRNMASGMGIKIIATVVGLLCNIVLALQWVLLDRCADKILAGARTLTLPR